MNLLPDDPMGDVRVWAQAHPDLTGATGVWFRLPPDPTYPALRLYRTGGSVQPGESPVQDLRVAFDVWGRPIDGSGPGTFADISSLTSALENALWQARGPAGTTTFILNGAPDTVLFAPDDTGQPRYVVNAVLTIRRQ